MMLNSTASMTMALSPAADLIAQQEELETEMTTQGIARFRAGIEAAREGGREDVASVWKLSVCFTGAPLRSFSVEE